MIAWRLISAGLFMQMKACDCSRSMEDRPLSLVVDFVGFLIVRMFVALIQTLPLDMGDRMCRGIAFVAVRVLKIRRKATEQNLVRVFPGMSESERRDLEFAMWHHLLLMVCEIAWAQRRLHRCNWRKHVQYIGSQAVLRKLLSGRPAIMVTGHYGNFEIGGYLTGLMGLPTTTIARRLDNSFLHDWVDGFRRAGGQSMVEKDGCAPIIDSHLRNNGVLTILADQHAGPKGCWVNFCGVPASCHKALALFSLTSKAPMLSGYTRRIGGKPMQFENGLLGVIDPLDDPDGDCDSVASMTEWYNRCLEDAIDLSPEH